MPYGTSRKRTARAATSRRVSAVKTIQAAARKRAFTKNRGGLKSVSKIQRQPYVPRLLKNTASISQLSRAVKGLQRAKLGEFQTGKEYLGFQPSTYFNAQKPMCFCVNDFVQYVTGVGVPTWTTDMNDGANKVSNFAKAEKNDTNVSSNEKNYYNFKIQDNTASKVVYQPLSSTMTFQAHANLSVGADPLYVRIDIVRQKKTLVNGTRVLRLPESIGGLGNMALKDPKYRNNFNSEYIHVLQTKYLYLNNKDAGAKSVRSSCKIHVPLQGYLRPDGDATDNAGNYTDWYNNISDSKKIWCIMSFSDTSAMSGVDINIMKVNRWRDQHGTD